jgi:hydroxyacyl-ACP dehydratase HTD2-like protein with hotdog domain
MRSDHFPVEAGHAMLFARATGETNPEVVGPGAALAPPTFPWAAHQFDPDSHLRPRSDVPWHGSGSTPGTSAPGRTLHAEQRYVYHRPVRIGDVLSVEESEPRTWDRSGRSGTLHFIETVAEYRDADGELVVTATKVVVQKGGTS